MIFLVAFLWMMKDNTPQNTGKIIVNFEELRNNKGKVAVAIYNGPEGFPTNSKKILQGKVATINDKKAQVVFEDLPYGTYAVVFIHDENENRDLDTNFIGIPVEGYGASNNPRFFFGPPKFEDASFTLDRPEVVITMKAKYLL